MNKIKIGQSVKWKCKPFGKKEFIAEGIVKKITKSCFGGKRIQTVALKIFPTGKYKKIYPRRNSTTIALYNIIN